ncbi:hypothetical protein CCICO_01970 [Corynebacterium ciconiae DSM 44920]|uniref:LssY C-terminal domain-containing protein n=1 Tax=Corynebacterium ciconiae TaxID=227319 RepID=UPI000370AF21|nr:LssY C-terminal domain-containing protein [Corynebacterium ciconiae]WKD60446.1 hypothetical protein CCICO_01970 [Corynebacterium ciconiae DSM 44920]
MRAHDTDSYPVPAAPPAYPVVPPKVDGGKRCGVLAGLDIAFAILALAFTVVLAWMMAEKSIDFSPATLGYVLAVWALMAYIALPRLHQLLTELYVPDYFIGRTRTADGLLGDPVNLALDGEEADIHAAMSAAGWTRADEVTLRSSWKIIISSVFRRSYPHAPVSPLLLFGRRQAFAYQQEVDGSASQRHHVRFWPTPEGWILPGGHRVEWLAAGSYDRGVGLSAFTGQVTHKIDADIDLERDYIINTMRYSDPAIEVSVIEDFSTSYHHRNGGGDQIHTDGTLPIVDVSGTARRTPPTPSEPLPSSDVRDAALPPRTLLLPAAFFVVHACIVAASWVGLVLDHGASSARGAAATGELLGITAAVVIGALCLYGTFTRSALARIGLMAMLSVSAVSALAMVFGSDQGDFLSITLAALAVYMVWAVSSTSVREWVCPDGQMQPSPSR